MGKPARSDMPQILFSNFPGAWFEAWVELDEGLKGTRRRTSGYELGDVIEPDIIPPVKTRVHWRRSHGGTRRLHSERSQHAFIPPFIRSLSPLTSLLIPLPPDEIVVHITIIKLILVPSRRSTSCASDQKRVKALLRSPLFLEPPPITTASTYSPCHHQCRV
jgi:hypothetical protein